MVDPMAGLGEDVPPPSMSPDALMVLALIRDTMLAPKPISREQAALAVLAAMVNAICKGLSIDAIEGDLLAKGGLLVNISIEMADSLLLRLDNPNLGEKA
jgi:hypothetical protein